MIRLEYNNKLFKLIDEYSVNKSSREVTFSSLKIDFTGKTVDDLPCKYQETRIWQCYNETDCLNGNGKILFTGYVNDTTLPNMKNEVERRELELELLSPMSLTTRRTINAIGTYKLKDLVNLILQPMFNDGFTLEELNINNPQITVNYLVETVESSLNKLSNKYNFWWYINENKKIYINDINYMFSQKPKLTYDDNNKFNGLIDLIPKIDATDYCNVVNFTNVRVYQYSYLGTFIHKTYYDGEIVNTKTYNLEKDKLFDITKPIKKDDTITFNHQIDIKPANIVKSNNSNLNDIFMEEYYNAFTMTYKDTNSQDVVVYIKTDKTGSSLSISSNVSITDDVTDKDFTFIRDSFFSNLITGFKYTGTQTITNITQLFSCSSLMWTRLKFNNLKEINIAKGKVSSSGQIEKIVDMKEQWKTFQELQTIASSYININSSQADKVELLLDNKNNLNVGDIIKINKPSFLINNNYIITDMNDTSNGLTYNRYKVSLKNCNYLESYIDLFRSSETEDNEDKVYNLTTIDFESNSIKEVHEVV